MRTASTIRSDRVAIYIRWSTEDQSEGTTLAVQREACESFVVSQGWSLRPDLLFVDDGFSGGSMDRPALARLRERVAAGEVDCVVVYKLDRLSRSVVDTVKLVLDEWDGRCHVKSAREPIDTLSQAGKMFFYQLVSFAEWERSVIRERTFAGKLRRAHEGRNPGITAAYGYRLTGDGALVIEPGEAAVVQLIFRLYLSGMGCTQISRRLAELGHPSPTGRRWSGGQLSRMLSNPIYIGRLVYGKQTTVRGRRVKSDRPLIVRENAAPAILDTATFDGVQLLKARRPAVGRKGSTGRTMSSRSLLAGLLKCRCGHSYCGNGGSGPRFRYRYYYCGGAQSKGATFCQGGRIRQDVLDDLVVQALLDRFGRAESRQRLAARLEAELQRRVTEAEAAREAADRELARLNEKDARLKALLLEGEITGAEYRELRADLNARLGECHARVQSQREAVAAAGRALADRRRAAAELDRIDRWELLEQHERKQLAAQFIDRVLAYRDKETGEIDIDIQWRGTISV